MDAPVTAEDPTRHAPQAAESKPYDKRRLSYAGTFTNPWKATLIRIVEWLTGKITVLRLIRRFEAAPPATGQAFFTKAMHMMGIRLDTPPEQIAQIPPTGPLVVVANHPHGLVDGLVLGEIVGRVRTDYMILTRSLLTGIPEIAQFMLPVPFPHEADSQMQSIEMRRTAMNHLAKGGVIILFPAGKVATTPGFTGRAVESEWNPFTAKMIFRSGASVTPIYFSGQNSRMYQIANKLSATVRQGLLLHEVAVSLGKPQSPVVGPAIGPEEILPWKDNPRGFMAWLRARTLALADQRVGTGTGPR